MKVKEKELKKQIDDEFERQIAYIDSVAKSLKKRIVKELFDENSQSGKVLTYLIREAIMMSFISGYHRGKGRDFFGKEL